MLLIILEKSMEELPTARGAMIRVEHQARITILDLSETRVVLTSPPSKAFLEILILYLLEILDLKLMNTQLKISLPMLEM